MNINEELYDLAERFVSGNLTEKERPLIEVLETDSPEFQKYVHQIRQANKVLFLEGLNEDLTKITSAEKKYFLRNQLYRAGKWTAGLLVVATILYFALQLSKDKKSVKNNYPTDTSYSSTENISRNDQKSISPIDKDIQKVKSDKQSDNSDISFITPDPVQHNAPVVDDTNQTQAQNKISTIQKDTIKKEKEDPCKRKMELSIQTVPTCEDKSEGSIRILDVTGGTSPFTFSIDQKNFSRSKSFNFLSSGSYSVWVKDANNCIAGETNVLIDSKTCRNENAHYVFSYQKGEDFKLPETEQDATFQLYNSTGNIVYKASVLNNTPAFWNGLGENGQRLTIGIYPFKMLAKNNEVLFSGTITIAD